MFKKNAIESYLQKNSKKITIDFKNKHFNQPQKTKKQKQKIERMNQKETNNDKTKNWKEMIRKITHTHT